MSSAAPIADREPREEARARRRDSGRRAGSGAAPARPFAPRRDGDQLRASKIAGQIVANDQA